MHSHIGNRPSARESSLVLLALLLCLVLAILQFCANNIEASIGSEIRRTCSLACAWPHGPLEVFFVVGRSFNLFSQKCQVKGAGAGLHN